MEYAQKKNVRIYPIDAMPIQQWLTDGSPVAVTTNKISYVLPPDRLFQTPCSWVGMYHHQYPLNRATNLVKTFNCFMNRMDPFRQSWLYQFVRRGLFDHGYISFNMDVSRIPWYKDIDPHDAFQDQFEKHLLTFNKEHDLIKHRIPYCNFHDAGDLIDACYDSRIGIVLETYFDDNNIITYSEKTFRALQIPRPWILFAARHAVRNLRDMGFDILDDMISHDVYDDLDSPVQRQTKILDLLPLMLNTTIDDDRLQQAARHNQNLLAKFSASYYQDIQHTIDHAAAHV